MEGVLVDLAGSAQGDELSVAVPGGHLWVDTESLENSVGAEAHGADGRLRDLSGPQRLLQRVPGVVVVDGLRVDRVAEPLRVGVRPERGVGVLQHAVKLRELTREVAKHADVLCALAGEEDRERTGRPSGATGDPVSRRPRGCFSRGLEDRACRRTASFEVAVSIQDEDKSVGSVSAEARPGGAGCRA